MKRQTLGAILHGYFIDHLIAVKGLRPGSVRSYRDTIRLLLVFVAAQKRCRITRLTLDDLTCERVIAFLRHLEEERGNHIRTRNQRLAALHSFFEYIAARDAGDARCLPTSRRHPDEARAPTRDALPRAR